ncbi:glycine betaine ABC transporter substrate-binding protein, partial [Escherichia coli]|uniref:glycine betaine ABC transporter substrate-binding protein n=1 Tax=Escherichia coli TaxID=562 RepID=UPI0025A1416E
SYTNFRTGTGPALDAAISAAVRRGEPVLFNYWSPTPLMGRFKLVQLEEPPFSEKAWATLSDPKNPDPIGSRSLPAKITIGVSRDFHAHYLSGRQRTLVRRLQDTFQARSEWPTWLLVACLYGGWALLASQYERWGW